VPSLDCLLQERRCRILYEEVTVLGVEKYDLRILLDKLELLNQSTHWTEALFGKLILLKPNLLAPVNSSRAVTTNPIMIEAISLFLGRHGVKVLIGDSSGGTMDGKCQSKDAYRILGLYEIAERTGAECVNIEDYPPLKVTESLFISSIIEEVDFVVSVPKFKTHTGYILTGAIKNLFGLVPGHHKARLHALYPDIYDFSKMLQLIYKRVSPIYTIVDAIVGMEGDGPMSGQPRFIGYMLSSRDGYAIDRLICHMMGMPSQSVPTLIGQNKDLPSIRCQGGCSPPTRLPGFRLPKAVKQDAFSKHLFRSNVLLGLLWPRINQADCSHCGICEDSCPIRAINWPRIDENKCIGCLCCLELCRNKAIELYRRFSE